MVSCPTAMDEKKKRHVATQRMRTAVRIIVFVPPRDVGQSARQGFRLSRVKINSRIWNKGKNCNEIKMALSVRADIPKDGEMSRYL